MNTKGFCRRHVEALLIVPGILAGLGFVSWFAWTRGEQVIDWVAAVLDTSFALAIVAGCGYLAWRFQSEYWKELDDGDEDRLHAKAETGDRNALWLIVKDRIEFLLLFVVLLLGMGRFAGANELIIKFEVSGEAGYKRCCTSPIWPGGQSGITWGIGYDGGYQHAETIRKEWAGHPAVERLATTAGLTGTRARDALRGYRDIRIEWHQALRVFHDSVLPRYERMALRAYGPPLRTAPKPVREALTSEVYNRGAGMAGDARIERRIIRDKCLPAADWACVAHMLETSCRVWAGKSYGPGLCNHRRGEARHIRTSL